MARRHKPAPQKTDNPANANPTRQREKKIDRQMEDTFPASDPPSYSGGNHIVGAPKGRESKAD